MATVTRDQIDAQLKDCDRLSAFLVQRSRATGRMRDASDYVAAAEIIGCYRDAVEAQGVALASAPPAHKTPHPLDWCDGSGAQCDGCPSCRPAPPAAPPEDAHGPAGSFGYCPGCYSPLDSCTHCGPASAAPPDPPGLVQLVDRVQRAFRDAESAATKWREQGTESSEDAYYAAIDARLQAWQDFMDYNLSAPASPSCACGPSDVCRDEGCQCQCHAPASPAPMPTPTKGDFWLGEAGRPGIPLALMDGPHDDRAGVERAAYLIPALGLGKPGRPFVCVEAIVTPVTPSADGVDHGAVAQNRRVVEKARRPAPMPTKGDES